MSSIFSTLSIITAICVLTVPTPQQVVYGQLRLRAPVERVADSLSTGRFESENLNMMGREPVHSEQFRRFVYLADSATTEELYALTRHESPVVRSYAFDALAYRHPPRFLVLVDKQQTDTAGFASQFFDMGSYTTVAKHLIQSAVPIYLRNYVPDSSDYSVLRDMAVTKRVPNALIALAQFKSLQDTGLIISYLDDRRSIVYGLQAISRFPSASFFFRVTRVCKDQLALPLPSLHILVPLYEALVQYQRAEALTSLHDALSVTDDFAGSLHRVALSVALSKHHSSFFDSLRDKLSLTPEEGNAVQELLRNPD